MRNDKVDNATISEKPCYEDVHREVFRIFTNAGQNGQSAGWFLGHFLEPESPFEKPNLRPVTGGDGGSRWTYPYRDRATECAKKYCALEKPDRDYLRAAREDGVFWRGDEIKHFPTIYDETMKMQADPGPYILAVKNTLRGMAEVLG